MQSVSADFLAALQIDNVEEKKLLWVVELYDSDAVPGEDGFDPAGSDCLKRFATVKEDGGDFEFVGEAYERKLTRVADVKRTLRKEVSNFSFTLSNSDRSIASFHYDVGFEGLVCVARLISHDLTTDLADSMVLFTGRCEKPESFDRSSETVSITAKQILNSTEISIPRRKFTPDDQDGRAVSDLEFEGFRFTPRSGVVHYFEIEKTKKLWLFTRLKQSFKTLQYSSHSYVQANMDVPVILGRVQHQLINFASEDVGTKINFLSFVCDGHEKGIGAIRNLRSVTSGFPVGAWVFKLGKKGGVAETDDTQSNDDPAWVAGGIYSRTALIRADASGSVPGTDDGAPDVVAVIFGQRVKVPDPADDYAFSLWDWTDNPVYLTRWLLESEYYFNLSSDFFDDAENLISGNYCDHVLVDQENTDKVFLPESEDGVANVDYPLVASSALLTPERFLRQTDSVTDDNFYDSIVAPIDPIFFDLPPINSDDPGDGVPVLPATQFRRRYTANVLINEQMKAFEFLHDILLSSFNGYLVPKANGKIAIKPARPADYSFVRVASLADAGAIHVLNVFPWVGVIGKVLIGANIATSEVRTALGGTYNTSDTFAISASGGVASDNATLQAPGPLHATLTVSSASGTKTVTIDGHVLTFAPAASDTTDTVAALIAGQINSHNILNKYIRATWNQGGATVLVESRLGFLTLDSNLTYAHKTAIDNPTDAPLLTELGSGTLPEGKYQVAYSYVTQEGETLTSPVTEITTSADDKKIETPDLTPLPSRVLSVRWYVSTETNGVRRTLHTENDGTSFEINNLSRVDGKLEPVINATAEEVHKIAFAFTDKAEGRSDLVRSNVLKGSFKFPLGSRQPTTNQVVIKFRDAAQDFAPVELRVNDKQHQAKAKKVNSKEIAGGACIDNFHQARRIANQKLAEWRDGDLFFTLTGDGEALLLEEGDVVCITDESGDFVNEPVRVEDITVSYGDGFPKISFVGRKYRRYYYDDQVRDRLVPLPIVRNEDVNRLQQPVVISQIGLSSRDVVQIGIVGDYSRAKFRKIQVADDSGFSVNLETIIKEFDSEINTFPAIENIERTTNLGIDETKYVRLAHSTNGSKYSTWSNTLTVFYENGFDDGIPVLSVSTGDVPVEGGNWLFRFPPPVQNGYSANNVRYRLLLDAGSAAVGSYDAAPAAFVEVADASLFPSSGRCYVNTTGETFGYDSKAGNLLTDVTRGVDGTTPSSFDNTAQIYPILREEELGKVFSYHFPQLPDDYVLHYRWQNSYRLGGSDGWSIWAVVGSCKGTGTGGAPSVDPPPPTDPAPPPGYEDPLVPPNPGRYRVDPEGFI